MSVIPAALAAATALGAVGVPAGFGLPYRLRVPVVGVLTGGVGLGGGTAGVTALGGGHWAAAFPGLLPLAGTHVAVDALAGLFVAVAGAVVVAVAVYGIGYAGGHGAHGAHGLGSRTAQAVLPLFALTLVLVPVAASVSTFLVLWELMALCSLLLVVAEHRGGHLPAPRGPSPAGPRGPSPAGGVFPGLQGPAGGTESPKGRPGAWGGASVRQAGVWYAVMTHLGLVLLLAGFAVFAGQAGGETFAALRAGGHTMSPTVRGVVFVLTALAFTSKAGAVPLHAWLPRAHPEAPSPVSALMSAVMVNLGVYGLVRIGMDLLGGGPGWWWLSVMAVGGVSAVYGILQAAMASDLKRLLAYSTSENMGLVLIGIGACGLFASHGDRPLAALALAAALLHVANHAAFKALLFCAAGSVLRATGLRDLDRLGGLRSRMPATAGLFALGVLGAVALPPGNGFISEWLLLQSLIHGLQVPGVAVAVVLPLSVALIALSAGIAATAFVKALGVGFFARPRSARAAAATEVPRVMLAGMALLGALCAALALLPGLLGGGLDRAAWVAGLPGTGAVSGGGARVRLADISATLSPLWVVIALAAALMLAVGLPRLYGRRRRRVNARLWDCGGGAPTPRMAYTATSFAEPLQRVFDDVLAPEQDVNVTPLRESAYLVERVRFQRRVPDRIERRLYEPVLRTLTGAGQAARRLTGGSVHRYLGYGFVGLVVVLVVLAVGW